MTAPGEAHRPTLSTSVSIIVLTTVLYFIGKGLTAYIPTPWLVGQVLIGNFLPAFLAVVSDTFPVAVGAALGTFAGDTLFLYYGAGITNPPLSLIAGVPANFIAFMFFGWFVKKYSSWSGFVAASVTFTTLGNFIAGAVVVLFGALVFLPAKVLANFPTLNLIFGYTVFWNMTSIPAVLIGVPILVRAAKPLYGRSSILRYDPAWSNAAPRRQTLLALTFAVVFLLLGAVFLVGFYSSVSAVWADLYFYIPVAALLVLVVAPLAGVLAGGARKATPTAT